MDYEEYAGLMMRTLEHVFPNYIKSRILKKLAEDGLILNSKRFARKEQLSFITDVSMIDDINGKFRKILESDSERVWFKYVEDFEFSKTYRHVSYFEIEDLTHSMIDNLLLKDEVNLYRYSKDMQDKVDETATMPTIKRLNDEIFMKFSYLLIDRSENQRGSIKYTVLAKINIKENILEISFDKVGNGFKNQKDFYANMIDRVLSRVEELLEVKVNHIDFKAVINYIKSEKDDVSIYAVKMHRDGKVAYLDTQSSEDLTMPILGELTTFIKDNKDIIQANDETIELGRRLGEFIEGIEVLSDYPSVKMTWPKLGIKLGVEHNYKEREYSFFMFFDELADNRERMDYVRKYLIDSLEELNTET